MTLLAGSVLWEDVQPRLAALHAGDWLVKLVAVAAIIGALNDARSLPPATGRRSVGPRARCAALATPAASHTAARSRGRPDLRASSANGGYDRAFRVVPVRPGPVGAAVALRAVLPQTTTLSASERTLLEEWLARIADADA